MPLALPPPSCRLTSKDRQDDVKMVAALVHKMLGFLEKETGGRAAYIYWFVCVCVGGGG